MHQGPQKGLTGEDGLDKTLAEKQVVYYKNKLLLKHGRSPHKVPAHVFVPGESNIIYCPDLLALPVTERQSCSSWSV